MNLADNACRGAFANECEQIAAGVDRLSVRALKTALLDAANRQLTLCGVPTLAFANDPMSDANGYFDFGPWALTFGGAANENASKTYTMVASLADTVYHESRHCEQWFRIAQVAASNELPPKMGVPAIRADAVGMAADLGIAARAAQAAVADSDYGASGISKHTIIQWFNSIYGPLGTRRSNIYAFLQGEYDRYRNLPEEQDAWRLGGALGDEVRVALNIRSDYPSHHDWMALTKGSWYNRRSTALKAVDLALLAYDNGRTSGNKALLKGVFDTWYGPKNGQTIRNVLDAEGTGVVDRLRNFLG
jgi:hypothetical protein